MNFTNRNQRNNTENDKPNYKKDRNPFLKNKTNYEKYDNYEKQDKNLSTKQLDINDTEEFPALPSRKKPVIQPTQTANSWASVAKINEECDTPFTNILKTKQNKYIQEQNKVRQQMQALTIEQLRRDKLNEELGEYSPYWGVKNLMDSDTDESSDMD